MLLNSFFWSLLALVAADVVLAQPAERVLFNRDVRPILSANCFACHGFDEKKRQADLRLDLPMKTAAGSQPAIVAGKPDQSEVWRRIISSDADMMMPPPDSQLSLSATDKQTIRRWIEQGAIYQQHWSFVSPVKPSLPHVAGAASAIDRFIQSRLETEGLAPAAVASREVLVRRLTLDLTGLPPTPDEVAVFVTDRSANAIGKLIDRLQSRVTYGEHMARYWLDLARYADTHGLHFDNERSMWPYRDWVVRAINENLPFDAFTRWQLAGDLLSSPSQDQLIASGFNRCNVTTSEGGSINQEWIFRYAVDRTTTAVEVWMGLTAGCAVCHDHKFDPLSTRDFYSMYAFFHSAADPAMDGNKVDTPPILKLTDPADHQRLEKLSKNIATIDREIEDRIAQIKYVDPATTMPPPSSRVIERVWFEDGFPAGVKPTAQGGKLRFVSKNEGEVFSGNLALKRSAGQAVGQDFFSRGAEFKVPPNGKIFVHCFIDPDDIPEAIMIQFHVGGWKHRAVWGQQERIPFGKPGTAEKVFMGPLPKAGRWVKLTVGASRLGLKAGTKVDGYAFTQFAGTVTWDRLGVSSTTNLAKDPAWSWKVWKQQNQGKRNDDLPEGLRQLVRGKKPGQWTAPEAKRLFKFWLRNLYAGVGEVAAKLEAEKSLLEKEKAEIEASAPITMIMADLPKPRESFVMLRGAYDKPGEKVSREVPEFLPPLPQSDNNRQYNRLDLANWLVDDKHPLTARVTVNRFWQQFFGIGLVKTSEDFGSQGQPPSHPALLDWLAVQFIEDNWDMKRMVRRIVGSHAYRQSSRMTPELVTRDPENRFLARGPRFRLDAEVLRDQALFVSGLLVPSIGGAGVKPYQPPNIWEPVGFGRSNTRYYKRDSGDSLYRRSLYTFLKRTAPPPFMSTFDAPNREQSCARRGRSNTRMQALQLMNDIQHVEAARKLAERMMKEGGSTTRERIKWGWRVVTSRLPDPDEAEIMENAFQQHRERYVNDEQAAAQLIGYGDSPADSKLSVTQLAAYTLVANVILNLDESVNRN